MLKAHLTLVLMLAASALFAQSGGDNTYDFLNLTNSARVVSLGGQQVSLYGDDLDIVTVLSYGPRYD